MVSIYQLNRGEKTQMKQPKKNPQQPKKTTPQKTLKLHDSVWGCDSLSAVEALHLMLPIFVISSCARTELRFCLSLKNWFIKYRFEWSWNLNSYPEK